MVSGLGNGGAAGANGGADSVKTVELASEFVIIPRMTGFEPPVFDVRDVVPSGSIGSGSLPQNISSNFGQATVIALAVRDLRSAEGLPTPERAKALRRVRGYLVKELGDLGNTPRDGLAASRLKQLKDLVDKALAP